MVHLPTEFCTIDGVPDSIRSDPFKMRNVIQNTKKNPDEKLSEIHTFSKKLLAQQAFKEWGIEVNSNPLQMETRVLALPEVIDGDRPVQVEGSTLRNLPIQKATDLKTGQWVIAYNKKRHFDNANSLYYTMADASKKLHIQIGEPLWLELNHEQDYDVFLDDMEKIMSKTQVTIVVILLENEHLYNQYKNMCYRMNLVSQVVNAKTCRRMNLSVATNIIKQINSKIGGELYLMEFPKEVSAKTMLIGIDVCHSGPNSIVGFCASINGNMSKYYS